MAVSDGYAPGDENRLLGGCPRCPAEPAEPGGLARPKRASLNLCAGLRLWRERRVEASRYVPPEDVTERSPLADALGRAATLEVCGVMEASDDAACHAPILAPRFERQAKATDASETANGVQAPLTWHPLERVRAAIVEGDSGTRYEILDGARHKHLSWLRMGRDASADRHCDARDLAVMKFALAGMNTGASLER